MKLTKREQWIAEQSWLDGTLQFTHYDKLLDDECTIYIEKNEESLAGQAPSNWISVDAHLPPLDVTVLWLYEDRDVDVFYLSEPEDLERLPVTHWMPLPEPPK